MKLLVFILSLPFAWIQLWALKKINRNWADRLAIILIYFLFIYFPTFFIYNLINSIYLIWRVTHD